MKIKDWSKFQHFKDRNPPWIKLYRDILDDRDWHELDGDSAKILTMLWVIASEDPGRSGCLPDIRKLSFRLRIPESQLKQSLKKLNHWVLFDDIETISPGYRDDAPETETEKEIEGEREKKTRKPKGSRLDTDSVLMPSWETFCKTERPDLVPGIVFSRFKDYWISQPGQRGVKLDWFATWRNWCRNEKQGKVQQTTGANKLDEIKHLLGMQEGGVIDA